MVSSKSQQEEREIAFFRDYYEGQKYNPTGWRLRLQRDLQILLKAFQRRSTGVRRVLSVGCGDGEFEMLLSRHVEQIVAIDISPTAIELGKRKALLRGINNIEYLCLPVSQLSVEGRFDAIVSLAFLHHLADSDLNVFLHQTYAQLLPNGIYYAQDPNTKGILRKIGRSILRKNYQKYHTSDERDLDAIKIQSLLKSIGYAWVEIFYLDFSLIPMTFLLKKGPSWPLYLCCPIDRLFSRSPFAPYASGFSIVAIKAE